MICFLLNALGDKLLGYKGDSSDSFSKYITPKNQQNTNTSCRAFGIIIILSNLSCFLYLTLTLVLLLNVCLSILFGTSDCKI